MRAPAFWLRQRPGTLARLMAPLGSIWGAVARSRLAGPGAHADVPVICVGNFVAGGAGKTPTAITVARLLQTHGERVGFLTRGYGGAVAGRLPLVVEAARHSAREVGDEPLLLAAVAPTIVCGDRVAGANAAAAAGAGVIVMDDGMQNPALAKDLTLAVVDGATGVGNGLCIPAGPLRAPLAAQSFSALVVVGEGQAGRDVAARLAKDKPVFRARMVADPAAAASLAGVEVVAFGGIGRPEKFFATLEEAGARIAVRRAFADHRVYTARDMEDLRRVARGVADPTVIASEAKQSRLTRAILDCFVAALLAMTGRGRKAGHDAQAAPRTTPALLVTTEKDFVRLPPDMRGGVVALPARLEFEDQEGFARWLVEALVKVRASR